MAGVSCRNILQNKGSQFKQNEIMVAIAARTRLIDNNLHYLYNSFMAGEIGISKWLSYSSAQKIKHLKTTENKRAVKLQKLTYAQAVKQTHQLLRYVDLLPHKTRRHKPVGIGVTLGTHKV